MRVAILQSNYIPWKGYFDIIASVDLFIFHDDLQYTKGDWRNRNKIKTPAGARWLTIPCGTNEKRLICDVSLNESNWQEQHWTHIRENYARSAFFKDLKLFFEEIYLGKKWENLSELNQHVIKSISCNLLGLSTEFGDSRSYALSAAKGERVIELLKKAGATSYLSGPAAKDYLSEKDFIAEDINLEWMDYTGYPEYNQLYPPFMHFVSIVDLLFNTGPEAPSFMLHTKKVNKNGRCAKMEENRMFSWSDSSV